MHLIIQNYYIFIGFKSKIIMFNLDLNLKLSYVCEMIFGYDIKKTAGLRFSQAI